MYNFYIKISSSNNEQEMLPHTITLPPQKQCNFTGCDPPAHPLKQDVNECVTA